MKMFIVDKATPPYIYMDLDTNSLTQHSSRVTLCVVICEPIKTVSLSCGHVQKQVQQTPS